MTNTTNYNLLLAEGTDLVNYLTQTNPNFSNLDSIIKGVSDLTVTPATEVTTGTAHAISKSLPDATVIKFTATSNWQTGDTMTLDGNPVTPLKTDGTTLKTGDYIIGSAVLMIQDGTRLTVLVASSPDAGDINYDNTVSGLTANKVQGAVDELAADVDTINSKLSGQDYVEVVTSGQSYSSAIDTLFSMINMNKINPGKSCLRVNADIHPVVEFTPNLIIASHTYVNYSNKLVTDTFTMYINGSKFVNKTDNDIYDNSATATTGTALRFIY